MSGNLQALVIVVPPELVEDFEFAIAAYARAIGVTKEEARPPVDAMMVAFALQKLKTETTSYQQLSDRMGWLR